MIAVGRMAERFHMLPHQVDQEATTYDLMIVDVLAAYDKFQENKVDPSQYRAEDLQALVEQTRGK